MEDKDGPVTSKRIKSFQPVKDYAIQHHISVQAVYRAVKAGKLRMRRIGTYMLVQDP